MMPNHYSGDITNHDAKLLAGSDDEYCDGCDKGEGWHCRECKQTTDDPNSEEMELDNGEWAERLICPNCYSADIEKGCGKTEHQCRVERQREADADRAYEEQNRE